jgi:hypothetical protein
MSEPEELIEALRGAIRDKPSSSGQKIRTDR